MSAVPIEQPSASPLRATRPPARPALRLVPPPSRLSPPTRRDTAYAATLALVLVVGVLGVLTLNTLMQQQARTIAAGRATLAALALRAQTVQLALDAVDNPRALARRATALHMRPVPMLLPLRPLVSARARAASRGPGG